MRFLSYLYLLVIGFIAISIFPFFYYTLPYFGLGPILSIFLSFIVSCLIFVAGYVLRIYISSNRKNTD